MDYKVKFEKSEIGLNGVRYWEKHEDEVTAKDIPSAIEKAIERGRIWEEIDLTKWECIEVKRI